MGRQGARQVAVAAAGLLVLAATVAVTAAAGSGGPEITVMLPGHVPLVLVRIPAGTFMMGSPPGERNRGDDEPQHQVTLTRDYYVGKYEVTQAQWQAIMGSDPSYFSSGGNYPVEQVSWDDIAGADGFLARLNRQLAGTGQAGAGRMRLPTEAEWERAARGGTTTRFSYGDALECKDACRPCATHSRYMWWCGDQPGRPAPVGGKQPNPYGLYDVHGNVWEWVQDRYGPYSSSAQTDPTGPSRGADRVVRGGGSEVPLEYSRSAARRVRSPDDRWAHTGLRLAWSP
jgi:formylglycine-generating enzyme required for sulfatase activity